MILRNPGLDFGAKSPRERQHFLRVGFGDGTGSFVVGLVSLLSKIVEQLDGRFVPAKREFERANHAEVVGHSGGLVPSRGEGGRRKLKGGVVGDVELPVHDELFRLTGVQVPVSETEQLGDFLPARLVLLQPPGLFPASQAHVRHRRGKSWGQQQPAKRNAARR